MQGLLNDTEVIFREDVSTLGRNRASRVWGFISKFVMLDRFAKALGAAEIFTGSHCPRTESPLKDIGRAADVNTLLPNTLILLIQLSDPRRTTPTLETCWKVSEDLA